MICEFQNRMRDPGDGSIHQEPNISVLKYAGDGLWSYEEDAYNPMNFTRWCGATSTAVGSSAPPPDEAIAFARKMGWDPV